MKGFLVVIGLLLGLGIFWSQVSVGPVQPSENLPTFQPMTSPDRPAPRARRIDSVVSLRAPTAIGNRTLDDLFQRDALEFVEGYWRRLADGDARALEDFAPDAKVTQILTYPGRDIIADYDLRVYKSAILRPHLASSPRARFSYADIKVGSTGVSAWVCAVKTNSRNQLVEDECYRIGRDRERLVIRELDWVQRHGGK